MGIAKKTDRLEQAVQAERVANAASLFLYKSLTAKIKRFQTSGGPAPTEEEFKRWVTEVEKAVALKRLLGGVSKV